MGQTPLKCLDDVVDIIGTVLFSASDSAAGVTGHVLVVDGGMSM